MRRGYLAIAFIFFTSYGCDKSESGNERTNYKLLNGTWSLLEITYLGQTSANSDYRLTFTNCATPPCSGVDYNDSDSTSGTFTYELIETDSKISIDDTLSAGGYWTTDWSIIVLDKSTLKIDGNPNLSGSMGNYQFKFSKQ